MMDRHRLCVCLMMVAAVSASIISQRAEYPRLVAGSIPLLADRGTGSAQMMLRPGPKNGVSVELVRADPAEIVPTVAKALSTWRFDRPIHDIPVAVSFVELQDKRCNADMNSHVEIRGIKSIVISAPPRDLICEEASQGPNVVSGSDVFGLVSSGTGVPIAGAFVELLALPPLTPTESRRLRTDERGRFVATGLTDGKYNAAIYSMGFLSRQFYVTATRNLKSEPLHVVLKPDPRVENVPQAFVTAADVPTYPVDAQARGVAGTVSVRLSFRPDDRGRSVVSDIDTRGADTVLNEAVRSNVATWRFGNLRVNVLEVRYEFQLTDKNCQVDPHPLVRIVFPHSVQVIGPSLAGCGDNKLGASGKY